MEETPKQSTVSLLVTSGTLKRAIIALEEMQKKAPSDPRTLRRLGTLYRQTGGLESARKVFAKLEELDPTDQEARYLHQLFSGTPLKRDFPNWPPNFLLKRDLLPPVEYQRVVNALEPAARNMKPVRVHGKVPRADYEGNMGDAQTWFKQLIRSQLASWCESLGIVPFDPEIRGVTLSRYGDGEFYPLHNDGKSDKGHLVEVIYFVDFLPNSFQGGELIMFDDREEGHGIQGWTALPPTPNTLLVFPSTHFHEIAAVMCDSQEAMAGRFMLSAWLRGITA